MSNAAENFPSLAQALESSTQRERSERDTALASLFENGVAGIAEVDIRTGRFVQVNRRFCEIERRSEALLLTMGPRDLILPEERDLFLAERDALLASHTVMQREIRHVLGDGAVEWVRIGITISRRDPAGAPLRAVAIVQDIPERLAAVEKLRLSDEVLRLGQQVGGIAVLVRDIRTDTLVCNAESRAILGLPPNDGDLTPEAWWSVIEPEDRDRVRQRALAALANRESEIAFAFRLRRPGDFELRHFEMRCRYFYDADGRPLRSVGVAIDVTDNFRAAEKLRLGEEMLRLGQQAGGIAVFTRDIVNQTIAMNAESRVLLGLPPGDEPMRAQDWFDLVLPEDRDHLASAVARAQVRGEETVAIEYRIRRQSDAAVRCLDMRGRYYCDAEGRPQRLVGVIIDITERRLAQDRLAHAARHDALTGLANRKLFRERLGEALARSHRGEDFAVLCLDLDRFKEVNDTLGHAFGDRLLVEATARIAATLRKTDTLARLGGDGFAIVRSRIEGPESVASLAQRIVSTVSEPYEFDGHKAIVGVSVGIALGPADAAYGEELLRVADIALNQAKGEGRGRYAFFTPEMNARMQSRRAMLVDLREALQRREFELFYQPIVHVASRRISGFEALIRWRRADGQLAPPELFVPLCEETGLICPLGAWVLEAAAKAAVSWSDGPTVAVNLSPLQFVGGTVEADVASALKASGLAPSRLVLEITESAMLHETETTLATLGRLKAQGIRIAMDDFGAGYSSLGYLQRFPFDRVKIDRAFTQDIVRSRKSHAIVKAMTELCDALQMSTTAEGVETEEQLRAVARIGCQDAQGYLFSRPRPVSDVPAMLSSFGVAGREGLRQPPG